MTERDPIDEQLERLLAHETMPADAIKNTLAAAEQLRSAQDAQATLAPPSRRKKVSRRRFVQLMAACLAVGALGCGGVALAAETAQIELDGRASIELGVNRWNRVVRIETRDSALASQLGALNLTGLTCSEVLARIADDASLREAVSGGGEVAFVTVCANGTQQADLLTDCESAAETFGNGSFCAAASSEAHREARQAGMGVARYEMYLRIAELDPSVTLDDCRNLPMCELRSLLGRLEGGDVSPEEERCGKGAGRGQHNGQGRGGRHANG